MAKMNANTIPKNALIDYMFLRSKENKNGCIEWTGYKNAQGYGKSMWHYSKDKSCHRSMMRLIGFNIEKKWVLHKCDNQCCINPDHLFVGTRQDNIDDMCKKGRQRSGAKRKDFCQNGHRQNKDGCYFTTERDMKGIIITRRRCKICTRKYENKRAKKIRLQKKEK